MAPNANTAEPVVVRARKMGFVLNKPYVDMRDPERRLKFGRMRVMAGDTFTWVNTDAPVPRWCDVVQGPDTRSEKERNGPAARQRRAKERGGSMPSDDQLVVDKGDTVPGSAPTPNLASLGKQDDGDVPPGGAPTKKKLP